jgi:SAM-dependent methyltransferase
MLAPRSLPEHFLVWNQRWQAPTGPEWGHGWSAKQKARPLYARALGPFAFQSNCSTRSVEYPWAFQVAPILPGMKVVEVGGALSGFQYVLAREAVHVVNVDPFVDYGASPAEEPDDSPLRIHGALNRRFGTEVELKATTLVDARLPADSVDRVYCISVIEHLGSDAVHSALHEIRRILKPGGLFILTVDLFLNLAPFTSRQQNQFGRNASVLELVTESKLELAWGKREELFGFPEFSADAVLSRLEQYYVGVEYPVVPQLLVLRKPGPGSEPSAALRRDVFVPARAADAATWLGASLPRGRTFSRAVGRLASGRI